jgi:hypothetical protein
MHRTRFLCPSQFHTSAATQRDPVETTTMYTTLYDLVEALQRQVGPDEDHLVVATVMHLLHSGRVTFLGELAECLAWWRPESTVEDMPPWPPPPCALTMLS